MGTVASISEAASLAFHSMVLLARHSTQSGEAYLNVKEIAQRTGASHAHLSKVLQRLAKAGLVRSSTGPHGGFALSKPTDQITLLDIYEAIEGPIEMPDCLLRHDSCVFSQCLLDGFLSRVTEEFRKYLAGRRLSDLDQSGPGLV